MPGESSTSSIQCGLKLAGGHVSRWWEERRDLLFVKWAQSGRPKKRLLCTVIQTDFPKKKGKKRIERKTSLSLSPFLPPVLYLFPPFCRKPSVFVRESVRNTPSSLSVHRQLFGCAPAYTRISAAFLELFISSKRSDTIFHLQHE